MTPVLLDSGTATCGLSDPSPGSLQPRNNTALLCDNRRLIGPGILNFRSAARSVCRMKTLIASFALAAALATGAQAECFAEYKAKQDDPLRLHYGIMMIPENTCPGQQAAAGILSPRLQAGGWTLLNIVGLSTTPPTDQQKANAGEFYLRY